MGPVAPLHRQSRWRGAKNLSGSGLLPESSGRHAPFRQFRITRYGTAGPPFDGLAPKGTPDESSLPYPQHHSFVPYPNRHNVLPYQRRRQPATDRVSPASYGVR
ncbi:hypothetical protein LIP_0967 [Limnochorda pilosa]|uniref:Uncharacterized protein n=1 Tax=Limnochorda pilosa TaxID=1555112 RepID=A0A0K2SJ15_LIMPI|nr:hypothetical protein LIP_0967 [Limnochorda pilosa]